MGEQRRYRLAILRNEMDNDHRRWVESCKHLSELVDHEVVDLTKADWRQRVTEGAFDGLVAQPGGWSVASKALYEGRLAVLEEELGLPMIPSRAEIAIYENKRALAHWLAVNRIPHPVTHVFEEQDEANAFLRTASFPLVAKTSMGAGGSGVRVLRTLQDACTYVERTFQGRGAPRDFGPRWRSPGFAKRAIRKLAHPSAIMERLRVYRAVQNAAQKDHVLFQQFVPHTFEWRAVRIGDAYFAHKKLVFDEKASGSLLKAYEDPPRDLLDLVRTITDDHGFRSVAIDLFETPGGGYLVNEVQCVFGQSDPHQMMVGGVPGRYVYNGEWRFEPGDFNRFESYLARLEYLLDVLKTRGTARQ